MSDGVLPARPDRCETVEDLSGYGTFSVAPDAQELGNCQSVKEERSAAYPRRAQGTTGRHAMQ